MSAETTFFGPEHLRLLGLYFAIVFGVVVLPGLDMAFVLASSLAGGRRAGLAATLGCVAGAACHFVVGALGLAAFLRTWPAAFNALLLAGALYMAWIGISLVRSGAALGELPRADRAAATAFRRGAATNLLNPKAYLFMLAVFPQFVRPAFGAVAPQAIVLFAIGAACQLAVYGAVAVLGDRARAALARDAGRARFAGRIVGGALVAAALFTAWESWRGR